MRRCIESVLISRLKTWRCVALMGARQVGKSYLLAQILRNHPGKLLSFDDPKERQEAQRDPVRYLESYYQPGQYLFIDEAARVPDIFSAVKIIVDRNDPKPTGICLANSGNYLLLKRIKESLAGRVSLLSIYPLSWQEFGGYTKEPGLCALYQGRELPKIECPPPFSAIKIAREREERMLWGGMPQPSLNSDPDSRILWARDYVRTYILPLVIEQFNIRESTAFEQVARFLMLQSGWFFNANQIAQHVGVSQPTIKTYAHLLEAMMVVQFLPVFLRNPHKRLTKQPKMYVCDPLLFNSATDNFSIQNAVDRNEIGRLYESFVCSELEKNISHYHLLTQLSTWRTRDQAEVDIVLPTRRGEIVPLEVKWSKRLTKRDALGLLSFLEDHPQAKQGYIVYPGENFQVIAPNVMAVPDWWLFGCY